MSGLLTGYQPRHRIINVGAECCLHQIGSNQLFAIVSGEPHATNADVDVSCKLFGPLGVHALQCQCSPELVGKGSQGSNARHAYQ